MLTVETGFLIITLQLTMREVPGESVPSFLPGAQKGARHSAINGRIRLSLSGSDVNAALVLTNLQAGAAGNYFLVITNALGRLPVRWRPLRVNPASAHTRLSVWLVLPTGRFQHQRTLTPAHQRGAGGARTGLVTARSYIYLTAAEPLLVEVMTNIGSGSFLSRPMGDSTNPRAIASRKTVFKNGATLGHGIFPIGANNVIIRNLKFRDLCRNTIPADKHYGWDYLGIRFENGAHQCVVDRATSNGFMMARLMSRGLG